MFLISRECFIVGRMHLLLKLRPKVIGSVIRFHLLIGVLLGLISRLNDLNLLHFFHFLNRVGFCSQFDEHDGTDHNEQNYHGDGDTQKKR